MTVENLATSCAENKILQADDAGGWECADAAGGFTNFDITDTDASPVLTVDDGEQIQYIGAGTVTIVAADDSGDHDVTITGSAHDGTGTDDQVASEVPFTPDDGAEWPDPDPTEVDGALENLAPRVIANDAKTTFPGFDTVANDYSEDVTDDDLSDDDITALQGVTTVTDGSFCQGGAADAMDCDVATIDESDLDANVVLDNGDNTYSTGTQDFSSATAVTFAADEILATEIENDPAISGVNIDSFPENFCKTLFDSGGLADTDDISSIFRFKGAATVTEVWCETDTGTASIDLLDGSSNLLADDCSCDNSGDSANTCSLTTVAFTDGELMDFVMNTAAGNRLTFCVEYDLD